MSEIVSKCCYAPIVDGAEQEGGWTPWLCSGCGVEVGGRSNEGALDLGLVRQEVEGR